jgi:zinc protease
MRRLIGALLLLAAATGAAAQQDGGIFPFDYRLVELDNGFKAYLINAGAPGQIAYLSVVRTGSRDEVEPGKSGFAHFFEHMMFRGTDKYPEYDAITAGMGAARNANTSNDRTAYYLVASSEYLEQIVDLESDRFMNLKYPEPDFRTEAGAVLGEYQQGALTPGRWLNEKIRETAFDRHTYRHTTIGFEADVRAMPDG